MRRLALPLWLASPWPAVCFDVGVAVLAALLTMAGCMPAVAIGDWRPTDMVAAHMQAYAVGMVVLTVAFFAYAPLADLTIRRSKVSSRRLTADACGPSCATPQESRVLRKSLLGSALLFGLSVQTSWMTMGLPLPWLFTTVRLCWWLWHAGLVERTFGAGPWFAGGAEPGYAVRAISVASPVRGWDWVAWASTSKSGLVLVPKSATAD